MAPTSVNERAGKRDSMANTLGERGALSLLLSIVPIYHGAHDNA
jgi:hypothetical protein